MRKKWRIGKGSVGSATPEHKKNKAKLGGGKNGERVCDELKRVATLGRGAPQLGPGRRMPGEKNLEGGEILLGAILPMGGN